MENRITRPALQVRALLEGQFLNMKLHSRWMGVDTTSIRLTGGASGNDGIAQMVADVFQVPVERLEISNSAALGAALMAAAATGWDLATLQTVFCKPETGSTLQPDSSLAPIYDNALLRFKQLLDANP